MGLSLLLGPLQENKWKREIKATITKPGSMACFYWRQRKHGMMAAHADWGQHSSDTWWPPWCSRSECDTQKRPVPCPASHTLCQAGTVPLLPWIPSTVLTANRRGACPQWCMPRQPCSPWGRMAQAVPRKSSQFQLDKDNYICSVTQSAHKGPHTDVVWA